MNSVWCVWRGCTSKRRYARRGRARRRARSLGLYFYPCPYCDGYHLTHKSTGIDPNERVPRRRRGKVTA